MQEFNSIVLATESTGVKSQSINRVCRHGCNTAGGYSWIYKEEYHSITKEELIKLYSYKYKKPSSTEHYERNKVKVICLNTEQVFDGIVDAIEYFIVGENTFQVQALESRNIEVQHEACVQYTFTVFHPTTFGSQSDRIHTQ